MFLAIREPERVMTLRLSKLRFFAHVYILEDNLWEAISIHYVGLT